MSENEPEPVKPVAPEVVALLRADHDALAAAVEDRGLSHGLRILELEHDLAALAELLGAQMGEPFRSRAHDIVSKRQITSEEA